MNSRIICVAAIVFVCAILSANVLGNDPQIIVKDLGYDGNGYEVRGQTAWYSDGSGVAYVAIDDAWVNGPDWAVILCHEFGHVSHPEWDEAACDDFANAQGVGYIKDAYNGVH